MRAESAKQPGGGLLSFLWVPHSMPLPKLVAGAMSSRFSVRPETSKTSNTLSLAFDFLKRFIIFFFVEKIHFL